MSETITINRAPVLTLWAAVVAERLGFERAEALTLGRAVAGMNAATKAERLGIHAGAAKRPRPPAPRSAERVELLGRSVAVLHTPQGLRAAKGDKPDSPESVERYLALKFGAGLEPARGAMTALARAHTPKALAEQAFALYEAFRPEIPRGGKGWGAKGVLDLEQLRRLTRSAGK